MKKLVLIMVVCALLVSIVAVPAYAEDIRITVNGKTVNSDVPAQIIDGRVMVPARALCEAMGGTVAWDSNTVIVTTGGNVESVRQQHIANLEYYKKNIISKTNSDPDWVMDECARMLVDNRKLINQLTGGKTNFEKQLLGDIYFQQISTTFSYLIALNYKNGDYIKALELQEAEIYISEIRNMLLDEEY